MRALLLQAIYSVRSERQLMEQLDCLKRDVWTLLSPLVEPGGYTPATSQFLGRTKGSTRFLARLPGSGPRNGPQSAFLSFPAVGGPKPGIGPHGASLGPV